MADRRAPKLVASSSLLDILCSRGFKGNIRLTIPIRSPTRDLVTGQQQGLTRPEARTLKRQSRKFLQRKKPNDIATECLFRVLNPRRCRVRMAKSELNRYSEQPRPK